MVGFPVQIKLKQRDFLNFELSPLVHEGLNRLKWSQHTLQYIKPKNFAFTANINKHSILRDGRITRALYLARHWKAFLFKIY